MLPFFLLHSLLVTLVCAQQPFVNLKTLGGVFGFDYQTQSGVDAEVFLGIPFAEPPLGDLRFEKPLPVKPWANAINGTKFGKECVPHSARGIIYEVSEDCLTINVIKPKKLPPPGGFPVLFWVHGGGYEIGSARLYGYKGFAEAYANRDVIIVSVQYRIGVLGFFSTGDSRMPGNLGLWDLALGLKFTYDHISSFDGNPSKITVWGLSAGGAAVAQLALSPVTRDYVFASIEMSGSAWAYWANNRQVSNNSLELAKAIGCDEDVKECLKRKTLKEIDDAVEKVGYTTDDLFMIKWGPRVDGEFLPVEPSQLAAEAPPKPVIAGVSNKDASFFTVMGRSTVIQKIFVPLEEIGSFDNKSLADQIEHFYMKSAYFGDNSDAAILETIRYFSRPDGHETEPGFYIDRYSEFVGDLLFNIPAVQGILERIKHGWSVYSYSFDHYNPAIWETFGQPELVRGSVHINEFTYMFDMFGFVPFNFTEDDLKIRENIRNAIVTFAHTGKPIWNGIQWDPTDFQMDYLVIRSAPEIRTGFYEGAIAFWNMLKKYGFDVTTMSYVEKRTDKTEL